MVARGAGAAGPVLLACRQWDPLGLARRLPSLGVGAWRSAPLLALAGAVPRPCVRGTRGRFGGLGPVPGFVSLSFPPSRPACPAQRVAGRLVRVSLTLARWYAIPRGLCVPRARSGCPSGCPRVPFACVCAHAPAASAPPPLGGVACAPRAVPALGAGRAVPRGPCPFRVSCPGPLLRLACLGGGGQVPVPPYLAWGCCCVGRLGSGAPPPPAARSLGRLPGPSTHWLWVRGVRAWGPVTNPTACPLASYGGGMRVPGGGTSCLGVGRPGSGALPPPAARPLGGLPGPTTHWLWVRGGAGVGTCHQPHSARSCELALRAVGAS